MAKYEERFKLEVAQLGAQGAISVVQVAARYGLDYSMVRRWVDVYRHHGAAGLTKRYRRYEVSFKREVLERIRVEGLSIRQATALYGIPHAGLIGTWQRQYDQGGLEALVPARERSPRMSKKKSPASPAKPDHEKTREELLDELAYLRAETAYLKKLDALIRQKQATARAKERRPSKD